MKISETIPEEILNNIIHTERYGVIKYHNQRERYYPYFELQDGKLAISVIAVKQSKKTSVKPQKILYKCYEKVNRPERYHQCLYIKKVTVHIISDSNCYCRDISLYGMGGYIVDFIREPIKDTLATHTIVNCYSDPRFFNYPNSYFRLFKFSDNVIMNPDFLQTVPEYRYCVYDNTCEAFEFLTRYKQNPKIELLAKFTNCKIAMNKTVIKLAEKDKGFVIWLRTHRKQITPRVSSRAIMRAYKTGQDIIGADLEIKNIRYFSEKSPSPINSPAIVLYQDSDGAKKERLIKYLTRNGINAVSYNDYIKAIVALGMDITDTKNVFPKDWAYWHDVRLNQYASLRAEQSEWGADRLRKQIKSVATKYKKLSYCNEEFIAIIAKDKKSLIKEGRVLNHCVGRMDYDQRIAKELSLIVFIRHKESPKIPFATVEFSLVGAGRIVQCYGENDNEPDEQCMNFVNNIWLPKAKSRLTYLRKKLEAECT